MLCGCAGGGVLGFNNDPPSSLDDLNIEILDGTYLDGGDPGQVSLVKHGSGVFVEIDVVVAGAVNLKAIHFKLGGEIGLYRATALGNGALLRPAASGYADALSVLTHVDDDAYGAIVLPLPQTEAGFTGDGVIAKVTFQRFTYGDGLDDIALMPPYYDMPTDRAPQYGGVSNLVWDEEAGTVSWEYYNPGDFDQNGIVELTDINVLARRIGEEPDEMTAEELAAYLAVLDANQDGIVSAKDAEKLRYTIGLNVTGGYNLYAYAAAQDDYPSEFTELRNASTDSYGLALSVPLSAGTGDPLVQPLAFSAAFNVPADLAAQHADAVFLPGVGAVDSAGEIGAVHWALPAEE
ncbi:hypothetical protein JW859_14490 [bacterium]|nr:hypothetical protein [bacterium]